MVTLKSRFNTIIDSLIFLYYKALIEKHKNRTRIFSFTDSRRISIP